MPWENKARRDASGVSVDHGAAASSSVGIWLSRVADGDNADLPPIGDSP
jgi:hypothetical protein